MLDGMPISCSACLIAFTASPSEAPGAQVEGDGHHRELALMIHGQGSGARFEVREGAERNLRAV